MANDDTRVRITASDESKAAFDSAVRNLETFKGSIASMTGLLATATAALAGLTVVGKFNDFVAAAAALDDMAEKTGASVESLSALASVAKVSGVALETVEGGLIKFAKAVNGIRDETQGAGKAFEALGLDPAKLRTLDTAEAFKVLADRLATFRDDGSKTAAVLEILGKSGAQLLPYLKDLAETGDLQAKVTTEQAAQAENLEKNLNRLFATKNAGFKEFSAGVLPTMDAFVKVLLEAANGSQGLREEIRKMAADGTIRDWAEFTAKSVAFVFDGFDGVVRIIRGVGRAAAATFADITSIFNFIDKIGYQAFNKPTTEGLKKSFDQFTSEMKSNAQEFNKDFDAILMAPTLRNRVGLEFERLRNTQPTKSDTKASVNFQSGKENVDKLKDGLKEIEGFVNSISERLVGVTFNEFEQLRERARNVFAKVDVSKLSAGQADEFLAKLKLVNEQINQLERRSIDRASDKTALDGIERINAANEKAGEVVRNFNQLQKRSNEDIEVELSLVGKLSFERQKLLALRKIDLDAQRQIAALPAESSTRSTDVESITRLAENAKTRTSELLDGIREKSRETWVGAQSAINDYYDRITNGAENTRIAFTNAFQNMEDALVNFTMSGKLDFKKFADSIISDLVRIQVRQSITAPLAKSLQGFDFSSLFGSNPMADGTIAGFASGGRPPVGRVSMVGERGPELFIPDVAGTIVPNSELGGGAVNIVQNIHVDSRSDRASILQAMTAAKEQAKAEILYSRAHGSAFA